MAQASHPAKPATAPGIRLLPLFLRNFVRNRETGLVLVAIVVGLLSGLLVAAISSLSQVSHALLFDIPFDAHLSATGVISWQRTLLVPMLGGLVLALIGLYFARRVKGQQFADAIEANALYGGRVSFRGSLLISIQTLLSNGFGGSVGLEAGYTQICSMFGSHVGQRLAARRNDMRLLVACGAAGAISAAFSAPLAGAFYAFEVVLGAYTSAGLVPVIASAVTAWLVARQLTHQSFLMVPGFPSPVSVEMIGQTVLIGIICAFVSILVMLAVAFSERCFQRITVFKGLLRPILGGLLLGSLALLTPTVLGAGHGAMQILLVSNPTWLLLTTTIVFKILASAISLGSGFRGGLFFASLLLGALIGQLYSVVLTGPLPTIALQPGTAAIAALAALGTGVLGAPFSMVCLALEITGDFSVTVGAVVASSVCALIVRELFGYSFATWRFHLRGEAIRGPQDVGWVRQMSAASLMRTDFENAPTTMPIGEAQKLFSPAQVRQIVLRDPNGIYAGIVPAATLHSVANQDEELLGSLAQQLDEYLLPTTPVREILKAFERSEADVLAVVDRSDHRATIGTLSEAHVLRTYGEELERRNQELFSR
ncbi:chloride channel protein [Bradyrhizobium sp. WBOS7]|uniref:Chloride channel protein n=1 Tax=Bradyrhizobium betae TaxID=244734 RepID=A0AAE9STZ5_9BRAD|nr:MULTISPECIES: chloride channel protein [Bradyrhizobium]MDD1573451.1 chloride channel protein [Bradyrhizobium sp. WBOS1]UUO38439.1 chloride channel protein [Bradyrhizobium sp. WBOS01]MDD1530426.1 chloride channel protein [Bradyrhizobium sp. WBOS2]MDD1579586.1 chloride channel protein [Bradyrhizobium sp. WBOS7]MDD1603013.1 chloride channel protein [Bradyrhizobium sp. WBOS16]